MKNFLLVSTFSLFLFGCGEPVDESVHLEEEIEASITEIEEKANDILTEEVEIDEALEELENRDF